MLRFAVLMFWGVAVLYLTGSMAYEAMLAPARLGLDPMLGVSATGIALTVLGFGFGVWLIRQAFPDKQRDRKIRNDKINAHAQERLDTGVFDREVDRRVQEILKERG